jgi:hypothetical protein
MELTPLDFVLLMRSSFFCDKFTQHDAFAGVTYPPE